MARGGDSHAPRTRRAGLSHVEVAAMGDEEFRADLRELVKKHSTELSAEELHESGEYLQEQARRWEVLE